MNCVSVWCANSRLIAETLWRADFVKADHYEGRAGLFAPNKHSHINGVESFWSYAKTRLVRFRGLQKQTFYLHLKECEFRFNHRQEDIYLLVLKLLRENPLS